MFPGGKRPAERIDGRVVIPPFKGACVLARADCANANHQTMEK